MVPNDMNIFLYTTCFFYLDHDKIRRNYVDNNGSLTTPSLNSTLLNVFRERLCSRTYENKPHLFTEISENHNAFTRTLISRSIYSKTCHLPIGLNSIKSNPYLSYLLNYDEPQPTKTVLTDLERYLIDMLFPHWDFLVCAESDEYVYIILLPETERDLFLLNTDLTTLMHDLIARYLINNVDKGIPIYSDCRDTIEDLIDQVEVSNGNEPSLILQAEIKVNEEGIDP